MWHYKISGLMAATAALALAAPAAAQDAGDGYVKVGFARTKLVDKGKVYTNGVYNPADGYTTRATWHGLFTAGYFPVRGLAIEGSIASPATTDNTPAGALAGVPNLGDDEFVTATLGGVVQPIKGKVSPYLGGGIQFHLTTQERDGLGVGLNVPSTEGPYAKAGVDFAIGNRLGAYVEAKKAWYTTHASGLLPLDATYTVFASVEADAVLDPWTFSAGLKTSFGKGDGGDKIADEDFARRWVIRGGVANLTLADKAQIDVAGAPLNGEGISTREHFTPSVQVGYKLAPMITANATLGFPPTIDVFGAGTIGGLPKLGKVTYGPLALTGQFHPVQSGRVRPYIGAGLAYMIVFGTKDGAFQDLKVKNDLGLALEAGTDFMVSDRGSLFLDVKKAQLRPKVSGSFMGAPVDARATLDPLVVSLGYAYRF